MLDNFHVVVNEETAQALKVFGYNEPTEDKYYTVVLKDSAIVVPNPEQYNGTIVNEFPAPDLFDAMYWLEKKFGLTFKLNKDDGYNRYWWDVIDNRTGEYLQDYSFIAADNEIDPLSATLDMVCADYLKNYQYSDNAAIYCPNTMSEVIAKLKSFGYKPDQYATDENEDTIYIDLHGSYINAVNGVITDAMFDEGEIDAFLLFAKNLMQNRTYTKVIKNGSNQ